VEKKENNAEKYKPAPEREKRRQGPGEFKKGGGKKDRNFEAYGGGTARPTLCTRAVSAEQEPGKRLISRRLYSSVRSKQCMKRCRITPGDQRGLMQRGRTRKNEKGEGCLSVIGPPRSGGRVRPRVIINAEPRRKKWKGSKERTKKGSAAGISTFGAHPKSKTGNGQTRSFKHLLGREYFKKRLLARGTENQPRGESALHEEETGRGFSPRESD